MFLGTSYQQGTQRLLCNSGAWNKEWIYSSKYEMLDSSCNRALPPPSWGKKFQEKMKLKQKLGELEQSSHFKTFVHGWLLNNTSTFGSRVVSGFVPYWWSSSKVGRPGPDFGVWLGFIRGERALWVSERLRCLFYPLTHSPNTHKKKGCRFWPHPPKGCKENNSLQGTFFACLP